MFMPAPAITTATLSVNYLANRALDNVSVTIPRGATTGIVGPNGSGKSTLMKAMLGLVTATGTVNLHGLQAGYMPQSTAVDWDFPTTVRDVVTMGTYGALGWLRRPGRAEKLRAQQAMEQTQVAGLANRQIGALSGGQRQRVFLARTLAQDPDILMMDEPFAGVDAASEAAILDVLTSLTEKTIVIVHHNLATVRTLCDHIILLKDGQLVAEGPDALSTQNLQQAYNFQVPA